MGLEVESDLTESWSGRMAWTRLAVYLRHVTWLIGVRFSMQLYTNFRQQKQLKNNPKCRCTLDLGFIIMLTYFENYEYKLTRRIIFLTFQL